ncbi:MAG TPA: globin [Pseudogracilibacillus sp.]|nr:globin [Pseudogracilibacillus sp.]
MSKRVNIYKEIGGEKTMKQLIQCLYTRIGNNETLLPIFPDNLQESARKQYLFLTQFLGGPPLYSQEIGPPMLPYRHAPFEITPERRDAWLHCIHRALLDVGVEDPYFSEIIRRLTIPAYRIMNTPDS